MLKDIFYLLIPENIRNIPIYKKVIDAFIDYLEQNSSISININNIFRMLDPQYKILFMETYAKSFYEVLKTIDTSNLVGAPESANTASAYPALSLEKMMTPEQIQMIKNFGENKGSKVSLEFVNNLIESLNTAPLHKKKIPFSVETVDVFHYNIHGNLTKESYEKYVKPLAHPVGFIYDYTQGPDQDEDLNDRYMFPIEYNVSGLTINYGGNQKIYSYLDTGYKVVDIHQEPVSFVTVDFKGNKIVQQELLLRVTFENGHYLEQINKFNNTTIYEYDSEKNIVVDYSTGHKNVYVELEYVEDDTKLADVQFSNNINYVPAKLTNFHFTDPNDLPRYGESNLYYSNETLQDDFLLSPYKFAYGYGTTKIFSESLAADEYINIRKYCNDNDLTFNIVSTQ